MTIEKSIIYKNKMNKSLKGTVCISIVLLMMLSSIPANAGPGDPLDPEWKTYPYYPPDTNITFPYDEGMHDQEINPIEWWYVNFQLIGQSTGTEYGSFVAFYQLNTSIPTYPQVRIFSISDLDEEKTYTNAKIGSLFASDECLDITFTSIYGWDYFYTKTDGDELVPFEYGLEIGGDSQEDDSPMQLTVDMDCLKKPLIVGGDGLIELGNDDYYSYYYSLTKCETSGTITVHGVTEEVIGYAWIDHQWGDFIIHDPPPYGLPVSYEWFSIKLDDNREMMAGDTWDRFTGEKDGNSFSGGINILDSNGNLEILENYTITQLDYWTDPLSGRRFAIQWRITEPTKPIDLIITPEYENQMMHATKDPDIMEWLADLIPGACF